MSDFIERCKICESCLPDSQFKDQIIKLHAGMNQRIAEIEGQLANREPFVVKMPCVIEIKDTKYPYDQPVKYYLADKITEAITAAGGVCE